MKTLNIYAALLFSIFAINFSFAQSNVKKETIKVWGNCGMCKTNIEKAAKKAGATSANWSEESKELKVAYISNKSSSQKIQEAIAKAGYDTQDYTADNKAYKNLHTCCQYERKGSSTNAETETAAAKTAYSCPIHPDVTSDAAGKCSKCGMDLTVSKKEQMKMEVMKLYSCPMHASITSDKAGKCSKCGMDLKQNK